MAEEQHMEAHYAEMDTTAHRHTYSGFLGMVKWGLIAVIITVVLVFIAIT